jgi:hypothetical protein
MTRCTSSIYDHSLKRIAFWASIGLPERHLTKPNAPALEPKHSRKGAHGCKLLGMNAKHSHLAVPSADPDWHFPHRTNPDPTASS